MSARFVPLLARAYWCRFSSDSRRGVGSNGGYGVSINRCGQTSAQPMVSFVDSVWQAYRLWREPSRISP